MAVGKLRQHSSKQVSELAKEIVKKWKTEVEREKHASGGKSGAKPPGAPSFSRIHALPYLDLAVIQLPRKLQARQQRPHPPLP